MKNTSNKITKSEWKVMEVIWSEGQLKASEVISKLGKKETWNDKTIRTLINRLVAKNILGVKKEKVNIFYPLLTKDECVKEETENFIKRVYNGSVGLLISNFVKNDKLTDEDIKMLKNLIEEKEKEYKK